MIDKRYFIGQVLLEEELTQRRKDAEYEAWFEITASTFMLFES